MKIYLIRHEERGDIPTFHTELTKRGKVKSTLLADNINELCIENKIKEIYCSPFLRVLQTILPYCLKYNKTVNVEYGLYEYINEECFTELNWKNTHYNLNDYLQIIINKDYLSKVIFNDFQFREDEKSIMKRIKKFIKYIKKRKKNIIIVSHMTTINAIIKYFDKTRDLEHFIPMGEIIEYEI
jgi:broad specificity phosphatase PhoE